LVVTLPSFLLVEGRAGGGAVVHQLRQHHESPIDHDLRSLRLVVTGGERADEGDAIWLDNLMTPDGPLPDRPLVVNAWGQTETAGAVLFAPSPSGAGAVPDASIAIVDGAGCSVPAGGTGEMVLRNPWPGLFIDIEGHTDIRGRYWRYRREGAFGYATGDLAVRHPSGELEIIRRLDSVVKVAGQLVSLADIAEALGEHLALAGAGREPTRSFIVSADQLQEAVVASRPA
jgi:acetyl-CoA synthetase